VYIYIPDSHFPVMEQRILNMLGMGRADFILNVLHGELTHDPMAYDESLVMAMDEVLVDNMCNDEYYAFHNDHRMLRHYEYVYGLTRRIARQYVGKLMRNRDWSFDLKHTDRGYLIDIY